MTSGKYLGKDPAQKKHYVSVMLLFKHFYSILLYDYIPIYISNLLMKRLFPFCYYYRHSSTCLLIYIGPIFSRLCLRIELLGFRSAQLWALADTSILFFSIWQKFPLPLKVSNALYPHLF